MSPRCNVFDLVNKFTKKDFFMAEECLLWFEGQEHTDYMRPLHEIATSKSNPLYIFTQFGKYRLNFMYGAYPVCVDTPPYTHKKTNSVVRKKHVITHDRHGASYQISVFSQSKVINVRNFWICS